MKNGLALVCSGALLLGWAADARASSGLDSPDTGVIQVGRGGAWLARADDPLAAYHNPAALVTQAHGVSLGAHLMIRSHCYDRLDANGQRPSPGQSLAPAPEEVCADIPPFPNPHLAASFRLHEKFAIGIAAVAPHAAGAATWPETIVYEDQFGTTEHPSPQRYLLVEADNLLFFPTLSVAVAPIPELAIGAGFVWGIASIDFANMAEATSSLRGDPQPDEYIHDIRSRVTGVDAFIPGFVASVLWSPIEQLDLAGWFRWSDAVRTSLDMYVQSNYYTQGGAVDEVSANDPANITDVKDVGQLTMPIPMEARIGVRYRHPRKGARSQDWVEDTPGKVRDPMSQDVFDIELDLTWANNSAVDVIEVRLPAGIQIAGTPGFAPENADVRHEWSDVLGIRLGGDFVVIPDLLSLRLGGFFESSAQEDEYLNLDFHPTEKVGIGGGGSLRLGPVDIHLAYQHTYFGSIDNGGNGQLKAISGDMSTGQRSRQAVNGGRSTSALDEIALGGAVHF